MKIDQAFIFYLLKNKELPLQGIGTFKLEGTVAEPAAPDKPIVIPADAISFTYNPRVSEDPNLVKFISETTGKILPLASADLDSYLTLGRQFLNIGKSMVLPNIGTLDKTNSGELVFKGEQHVMESTTPHKTETEVEEAEEEPTSFSDFQPTRKNGIKGILYLLILVILGLIVWAIWKYGLTETADEETITHTEPNPEPVETDTDSTNQPADSANATTMQAAATTVPTSDTIGFQIVVGTYRTFDAANNRVNDMKLNGRNIFMYTDDSVTYNVAEPFPDIHLRDTLRVRDSMRAYYGERPFPIIRRTNR